MTKAHLMLAAVMLAASCTAQQSGTGDNAGAGPSSGSEAATLDSTSTGLIRADALDAPLKHAWNLFMLVNAPAKDPKTGRGVADESKPIGAPGTTTVWETWRLARSEVFLPNDVKPPEWDDLSLPGGPTTGKVPEIPKDQIVKKLVAMPLNAKVKAPHALFDPEEGIFQGSGGFGESRMNHATYDFIRENHLYSLSGLSERARRYIAGQAPAVVFPANAMEVKAAWRELTPQEIAAGKDKSY
ncbi:MAG: hypothetical protein EON58_22045, partial [Alphaproteobacteria bacterium]